jgi:hypothetical protein
VKPASTTTAMEAATAVTTPAALGKHWDGGANKQNGNG